jgi:polyribonucleotide nucleotidyltransferase
MIDRPIRPLWPKGYKNEVHVVCTTLSADLVNAHDILCINGASAALMVSPLPFMGPVGAVRIGRVDGELVINPSLPTLDEQSTLDLVVVGSKDALTMIEAGADEVPEATLLEAFELAHGEIVKICEAQEDLRRQVGKDKWLDPELTEELEREHAPRIQERIGADGLREAGAVVDELVTELSPQLSMDSTEDDIRRQIQVRSSLAMILERQRLEAVITPVREQFEDDLKALTEAEQDSKELKSAKRSLLFGRIEDEVQLPFPVGAPASDEDTPVAKDSITRQFVKKAAEAIYKELVRRKIAVDKRRPDGREPEEIRPITCEVGVAPRVHGSGLFTRGQTQILSLLTLGTAKEASGSTISRSRPTAASCTTTTSRPTRSGRRASCGARSGGHRPRRAAQRALEPMIPSLEDFPYTIRIVSETLESNGSSSMGSVCGSTLALQDAGVPIKAPVGGIAMGLVKEGDDYVILTDIQGAEDHLGDMDFKVAGSRDGITALQMDIKITGVTQEIMRNALAQAKQAREFILDRMARRSPRAGPSSAARSADLLGQDRPREDRDGDRQGRRDDPLARGDYEVQIDIEEDGTILIYATDGEKANAAIAAVESITKEPEVGTPTPAASSRRPSSAPSSS